VLSLGVLGAGTNNSRIAGVLRNLSGYYAKEPNHLFLTRIAQGLLHMGKGLMTLDPFSSDRFVMSKVAAAGLVALMHSALDSKNSERQFHFHFLLLSRVSNRQKLSFFFADQRSFCSAIMGSSKRHYLLFSLVVSVRPRMLICVDEELIPIPVKVRVGNGVDIVGMAGK